MMNDCRLDDVFLVFYWSTLLTYLTHLDTYSTSEYKFKQHIKIVA